MIKFHCIIRSPLWPCSVLLVISIFLYPFLDSDATCFQITKDLAVEPIVCASVPSDGPLSFHDGAKGSYGFKRSAAVTADRFSIIEPKSKFGAIILLSKIDDFTELKYERYSEDVAFYGLTADFRWDF